MKRPIVISAIISLLISACALKFGFSVILLLVLPVLALVGYNIFLVNGHKNFLIFALAIITLLNTLLLYSFRVNYLSKLSGEKSNVEFIVVEEARTDNSLAYIVKITESEEKSLKGSKVYLFSDEISAKAGDKFSGVASFYSLEGSTYRNNNYSRNIFCSAYLNSAKLVSNKVNIYSLISDLKTGITNCIFDNVEYDEAATISGIVLGDKSFQEKDIDNAARKSGVSHIMVVSGMHMVIICGSVYELLRKAKINKIFSVFVVAFVTTLLMALCGFNHSVVRAGITYFIMLFSLIIFRRGDALCSLSFAVIIMLLINPFAVGSLSFSLSVSSTAGIIILQPFFVEKLRVDKIKIPIVPYLIKLMLLSISAFIATLPILLLSFGGFSTVSVITNLLISNAVTILLVLSFVAIIISPIPLVNFLTGPIFYLVEIITRYTNWVIMYFGQLDFSYISFI